jgi:alpha-ketoglutarate-dependent taurine dioxygenase
MEPADARARGVADYFKSVQANAFSFNWQEPNTFLVIDNRAVLHGRATVAEGDADRVLVRKAFRIERFQ